MDKFVGRTFGQVKGGNCSGWMAVEDSSNSVENGSGGSVWWEGWGDVELCLQDESRYRCVRWYAVSLGEGDDGDGGRWVSDRFREGKLVGSVR